VTAKVSYSSLLPASTAAWRNFSAAVPVIYGKTFPQDAANQRLGCQSPHFTGAEIYVDNLPFAIDGTESVPEGLKDVSVDADKSVCVYCSKTEAGN
jgi:hypothetical protein